MIVSRPTQRALTTPSSLLEAPAVSMAVWVVVASVAFVIAGILWPQAAEALLRLFLVTAAAIFVACRAFQTVGTVRTAEKHYSPFDRHAYIWTPPATPHALRELSAELEAAGTRSAQRRAIPRSIRLTVRREVLRQLAVHHGLRLRDPSDYPRVRSLVSEPTWLLIRPYVTQERPHTRRGAPSQPVPLSQLGRILDDLEAL